MQLMFGNYDAIQSKKYSSHGNEMRIIITTQNATKLVHIVVLEMFGIHCNIRDYS